MSEVIEDSDLQHGSETHENQKNHHDVLEDVVSIHEEIGYANGENPSQHEDVDVVEDTDLQIGPVVINQGDHLQHQ